MVVWGILSLLCVFCLYVRLWSSQWQKNLKIGAWNFACMLAYYPNRSSPLSANFGSRGVAGAALLSRMYVATEGILGSKLMQAVGIGGGGFAEGRMVGFASADALVLTFDRSHCN